MMEEESSLREIDGRLDTTTTCKLCFLPAQLPYADNGDEEEEELEDFIQEGKLRLGPLYEYVVDPVTEVYCAHYFCLLFSSGLDQNGEESEGMKGFLPQDILREWRRGQKLKCFYCNKRYPTVGCVQKSCRRTYHAPCAIKNNCLLRFGNSFPSFCHEHKPVQEHPQINHEEISCGICLKGVGDDPRFRIWAPCCNGWFHFACLDKLAQSSGYFFKCPLCNNKEKFEEEVKNFGIHVPEQDASWEMENDAFISLLSRHGSCDADNCLCPQGRNHDADDTDWEVILCKCCGSQGIHLGCLTSPSSEKDCEIKWKCEFCTKVVDRLPPTLTNVYYPVIKRKKDNNSLKMKSSRKRQKFEVSDATRSLMQNTFIIQDNQLRVTTKDGLTLETKLPLHLHTD